MRSVGVQLAGRGCSPFLGFQLVPLSSVLCSQRRLLTVAYEAALTYTAFFKSLEIFNSC